MKRTLLSSAVALCFSSVAVLANNSDVFSDTPKGPNLTSSIHNVDLKDSFVNFEANMKKSPSQEKFTKQDAQYDEDSDDEADTVKTKINQQNTQKDISTPKTVTGFWGTGFGKFLTSVWTAITSCF